MTTTTPSHRRGVRPLSRFVLPPDGPRSGWPQQPRGPRGLLKWPLWKADSRIVRGGIRNSDDSAGSIRCPLCPRKRTLSDTTGMSALCQKRTNAPQQETTSGSCHATAFNLTLASKPSSRCAFSVERYPSSNKRAADLAQIGFIKSSAVALLGAT
jgi:hypothetical protein